MIVAEHELGDGFSQLSFADTGWAKKEQNPIGFVMRFL